jgi:hypothetical protein
MAQTSSRIADPSPAVPAVAGLAVAALAAPVGPATAGRPPPAAGAGGGTTSGAPSPMPGAVGYGPRIVPGEAGVAGAGAPWVAGDACVAGEAAGAAGTTRGVGAGSSFGSGKLFTVGAFSQLSLAGSSCQRAGEAGGATAGGRGEGAIFGATAGARGDCTRAAGGTPGAAGARGPAGAFGADGDETAGGRTAPTGRLGAPCVGVGAGPCAGVTPRRASRGSLTAPGSLIPAPHANGVVAESASTEFERECQVVLDDGAHVASCPLRMRTNHGPTSRRRRARCLTYESARELFALAAVKT